MRDRITPATGTSARTSLVLALVGCLAVPSSACRDNPTSKAPTPGVPTKVPLPSSLRFRPSVADIANPERGTYASINLLDSSRYAHVRGGGHTLAYAGVKLNGKSDTIAPALLERLGRGLDRVRKARFKVILRFFYNSGPIGAPDAPRARILTHLRQLRPLLVAQADVIAVVQAGLIGAWGEWHGSTHGLDNTASRRAIVQGLLAAVPADRFVQLRRPQFKAAIFEAPAPLAAAGAFKAEGKARVGHHNDCVLASGTDMGTYPPKQVEKWKRYLASETRYVPMGGETCKDFPPRTACAPALAELARLHFSYLNSAYHPAVIARWKRADGCWEELRRKLGYRLVLDKVRFPTGPPRAGVEWRIVLTLKNEGWAAPFNARPVLVVLDRGPGGAVHRFAVGDAEPRKWQPRLPLSLELRMKIPASVRPGTYRLSLWLPDASRRLRNIAEYAIRLANVGLWDAKSGYNVLRPRVPLGAGGK